MAHTCLMTGVWWGCREVTGVMFELLPGGSGGGGGGVSEERSKPLQRSVIHNYVQHRKA